MFRGRANPGDASQGQAEQLPEARASGAAAAAAAPGPAVASGSWPASPTDRPRVFISYRADDSRGLFRHLSDVFTAHGWHVFQPNTDLVNPCIDEMAAAVRESTFVVVILSPTYFDSKYCCAEATAAMKAKKPTIAVYDGDNYRCTGSPDCEVMSWKKEARKSGWWWWESTRTFATKQLRDFVYEQNVVRARDAHDGRYTTTTLLATLYKRCAAAGHSLGDFPTTKTAAVASEPTTAPSISVDAQPGQLHNSLGPDAPVSTQGELPSTMHAFVALEACGGSFSMTLRNTVHAQEDDAASLNCVDLKVAVGAASAEIVTSHVIGKLPCLLWCADGFDVLPISPDNEKGRSSEFISSIAEGNVRCALAVVCMTYGAEEAARELAASGVADCVLWLTPTVLLDCAIIDAVRLVRDLLRPALVASELGSSNKPVNVKAIVRAKWSQHGVINQNPSHLDDHSVNLSLASRIPRGSKIWAVRPKGSFFEEVYRDNASTSVLDAAHLIDAESVASLVASPTENLRFIAVAPQWNTGDAEDEHSCASHIAGVIDYACASTSCGSCAFVDIVDFPRDVPFSESTLEHLLRRNRNDRGVVWIRPSDRSLVQSDAAWAIVDWIQACRERESSGMSQWTVIIAASFDTCQALSAAGASSVHDVVVTVKSEPVHGRMEFSQCDLIRLKDTSGHAPSAVAAALRLSVSTPLRWIGALYADGPDIVVSLILCCFQCFSALRESVLLGKMQSVIKEQLARELLLDVSLFSRHYARIVQEFSELTAHQKDALARWGGHVAVLIEGGAGTGKTFVALHKMLMLLVGASGGRDAVHVFFVAPHEGLCIYFANWLMRRLKRPDAWGYSAIRRLNSTAGIWVAHKGCDRLYRLRPVNGVLRPCYESTAPTTFLFGIADEAHHIFRLRGKKAYDYVNALVPTLKQLLLASESWVVCSDDAQAEAPWALPLETTCNLQLTEVVRNSRRIFEGCQAFRSGRSDIATVIRTGMNGPPLRPFVFTKCSTEVERKRKYADAVRSALDQFNDDFPGIPIGGNTAIIVRDSEWAKWLEAELLAEYSDARIQSAADAHNTEENDAIILDTVEHFDGMELLVIIAVGLDQSVEGDAHDVAQCQIYRAITRAHCFVAVVQEFIPNGRLAFLAVTELDEREPVTTKPSGCLSGCHDAGTVPIPAADREGRMKRPSSPSSTLSSSQKTVPGEVMPVTSEPLSPRERKSPSALSLPSHDATGPSSSSPVPLGPDSNSNTFQLASSVWQCNGGGSVIVSPEMLSNLWVPQLCRKILTTRSPTSIAVANADVAEVANTTAVEALRAMFLATPRLSLDMFKITKRIGERSRPTEFLRFYGINSAVFEAVLDGRVVVIKVVYNMEQVTDDDLSDTFKTEYAVIEDPSMSHPNVVAGLGHFVAEASQRTLGEEWDANPEYVRLNTLFIVVEPLEQTLQTLIRHPAHVGLSTGGLGASAVRVWPPVLPTPVFVVVMQRALRGLVSLSRHGIVHRDIKADNVMITYQPAEAEDGGLQPTVLVKLVDLGHSLDTNDHPSIVNFKMPYFVPGPKGGAPAFLAPEVMAAEPGTFDDPVYIDYSKNDVFAAGMLAHYMLTNGEVNAFTASHPHYSAATYNHPSRGCPSPIADLVWAMVNPSFEHRITAEEALARVDALIEGPRLEWGGDD